MGRGVRRCRSLWPWSIARRCFGRPWRVPAGIAEDEVLDVIRFHLFAGLAGDDAELGFERRVCGELREHDVLTRSDDCSVGLHEEQRVARVCILVQVVCGGGEVPGGPDELAAGRDRRGQPDVGQVVGLVGEADAVKKRIPVDGGDLLVAGWPVRTPKRVSSPVENRAMRMDVLRGQGWAARA